MIMSDDEILSIIKLLQGELHGINNRSNTTSGGLLCWDEQQGKLTEYKGPRIVKD